ncbi:MAG: T9SS type A sorting domain-containing protein, partial [Chitinophagaceae bacterium]|nr:T9SS type A sorting domain-containing protein [Chitinophagaceae bacterium]
RGGVVTPISAGGSPSVTYTTRTTSSGTGNGATSTTILTSGSNYSMQIFPGDVAKGIGITTVSGLYPTGTLYNSTLSSNTSQIVWTFNMKINRNTFPLSGFTSGNWAGGVVFAATNEYISNLPASPTPAAGYAVVFEKGTATTNTTIVGATASSSTTVTVASLTGIQVGQAINNSGGTSISSSICVTSINTATKQLTLNTAIGANLADGQAVNFSATTLKLKRTSGGFGTTGGTSLITPTTDFFQGGVASTGSTSGTYSATNPYKTDWISVKVIYTPGTGWELLARGDGKDTPNSDFSSGFTSLGTSSDASYVSDTYPITNFGFLWNHGTSASYSGQAMAFDNFSLTVNNPTINSPSVSSLSGFTASSSVASSEQSFTISGQYLTNSIVATAPTGFEVSATSGGSASWGATATLTNAATVAATSIYVRLKSGLSDGSKTGNITIASTGATSTSSYTVALSGTVSSTPALTPTVASLSAFANTAAGSNSASKNFSLSGVNLTGGNVTVTAPSNFKVATSDVDGSYGNSITLTPSSGSVSSTIYVRYSPTGDGGYSGNVVINSPDIAVDQNVTVSGYLSKFYYKSSSTSLATLANWSGKSDGTGTSVPNDFTTPGISYILLSNATTTDVTWNVAGTDSKIVVGDPSVAGVTLTVASGFDITTTAVAPVVGNGAIDIPAALSGSNKVYIDNAGAPSAFGTMDPNSEVHFRAAISTSTAKTFGKMFIESNASAVGAAVTFSGFPVIAKSLTVDAASSLTVNSSGNPYVYINTTGVVTINGTLKTTKPGGLVSFSKSAGDAGTTTSTVFQFFDAENPGANFILGNASSVEFSRGTSVNTQNIAARTYNNLSISGVDNNKSLSGAVTVNGTFTLNVTGTSAITGLSNLTLGNGATIVRTAGTFDGSPTFGSSVNLNYNGTTAITSGFEIPSDATELSNLTLNNAAGLILGGATKVNGILTLSAGTLTNGSNLTLGNSASIVRSGGSFDAAPTFGTAVDLTYTGTTAINSGFELPSSTSVLRNLTLNNAAGLTLASDATVNNTITLTSGKLTVAAGKTLTLPSATSLINGASSTKYIVTANDGTNIGKVKLTGFATAKTLPVGTTSYYLPVSLTPASSSDFEVSVFQGATTNGALGGTAISADKKLNIVDAVWTVNRTSGSGNCTLQMTWDVALEGATFNTDQSDVTLGISRYDGSTWSTCTKSDGTYSSKSVTQTFSAFSPFIIGSASFTLPVTLTNISATVKPAGVELVWETANEDGIRQYVVEKSSNGVDFNAIGFVNASNKGKYIFTDGSASTGVFYYRLKIVSVGGEIAYSKVMMVKTAATVSVSVYPNPVANSITISGLTGKTSLKIINTAGVTLKQINTAASTLSLDVNDLKAGIYMIQAVDASGRVKTVSFIKL